jgi:hypothetical protein
MALEKGQPTRTIDIQVLPLLWGTTSPSSKFLMVGSVKGESMAESHINKKLSDKRKDIGSLERDLEQARRDLSSILAAERCFSPEAPR